VTTAPAPRYRFGDLVLSPGSRLLLRGGEPVALPPRYLDLLLLLVAERHRVVSRDEIHQRVWGGVAVTDGAFTQAIRTLRRALGDDDPREPRFLRTAARHGYQFVATGVEEEDDAAPLPAAGTPAPASSDAHAPGPASAAALGSTAATIPARDWLAAVAPGFAGGAIGAALAGVVLAVLLGTTLVLATDLHWRLLAVLCVIAAAVGAWGGGAVGAGIAAGEVAPMRGATTVLLGAIAGGLAGALGHALVGWTMSELLGHRVTALGGALEGAVLGGAVALGVILAARGGSIATASRGVVPLAAAVAGALAAGVLAAAGARLSASSLDAIADALKGARLMVPLGVLLGEHGGGPATRLAVSLLEGGFFGAGVAAGLRRALTPPADRTAVAPQDG
jgi:DNA-binding winged helix-turn-helix (wHTH) protein